jgi:hypothetical protein
MSVLRRSVWYLSLSTLNLLESVLDTIDFKCVIIDNTMLAMVSFCSYRLLGSGATLIAENAE